MNALSPFLRNGEYKIPKSPKPRSVGIRQVSIKNNRSVQISCRDRGQIGKQKPSHSINKSNQHQHLFITSTPNNLSSVPSVFFQKCLQPTITKDQTLLVDIETESIVFYRNQSETYDKNEKIQSQQTKPKSIKIGSKAQKYRQNNKSEPKKVSDFNCLTSSRDVENQKVNDTKINHQTPTEIKKTQRKSSPNIFVCTKSFPNVTDFTQKLKNFEQDLQKTKKPHTVKLHLQTSRNTQKQPFNKDETIIKLKNHVIGPKLQPFVFNDIRTSPSHESRCSHIQTQNQISPASQFHFSYSQPLKKDEVSNLEKTRKITNHFIESFEMVSPRFPEGNDKLKYNDQITQIEQLMPTKDLQFVLNKFSVQERSMNDHRFTEIKQNSVHKTIALPQPSLRKEVRWNHKNTTEKKEVKVFSFKELQNSEAQKKETDQLRTTDYARITRQQNEVQQSALSQRRNSIFETNQKRPTPAKKYQPLHERANTIITKYDGSQKRSIVDESIIIFQCSKDLQPSFSKQVLENYTAKYRGSLGVEMLIKESDDEDFYGNEKDPNEDNKEGKTFDNVLMSQMNNSTNLAKLRKSYSIKDIKQVEASIINF